MRWNYILCLCYVCTQYKQLNDNLVDVFNYNLNKSAKNDKWDKQNSKTNNWEELVYYAMSVLNISN